LAKAATAAEQHGAAAAAWDRVLHEYGSAPGADKDPTGPFYIGWAEATYNYEKEAGVGPGSSALDPIFEELCPGRPGRLSGLSVFHIKTVCMRLLYGRAGCLTTKNGGFRPGQWPLASSPLPRSAVSGSAGSRSAAPSLAAPRPRARSSGRGCWRRRSCCRGRRRRTSRRRGRSWTCTGRTGWAGRTAWRRRRFGSGPSTPSRGRPTA
jgi:hypothetical protein